MGATDTMEIFFEKLNDGDRQGAVDLMDEKIEMRVHVRDGFRTLRGVAQVGGWFLRGDAVDSHAGADQRSHHIARGISSTWTCRRAAIAPRWASTGRKPGGWPRWTGKARASPTTG